jgi:hypothetical protein
MADDINPQRRAELVATRDDLEPVLRGLHDTALTIISSDLKAAFDHQINVKQRRLDLVNAELDAMDRTNDSHDALVADGYPTVTQVMLEPALFAELQRENADRAAAAAIFKPDQAANLSIAIGSVEAKPGV